jgi:two-component sensor histidine kinase
MALIREKLYQSEDIARVDFAEYIRNLAGNLIRSYGSSPAMVKLIIDADQISLGVDTAIPCGLIINELLTNSLKYAFPDGRRGEIRVSLKRENGDGLYRLVVADNGVGLPASIEPRKTTTLGLQLVTTLVDQLNGSIEIQRGNGTEFIVTFPEMKAREPPPRGGGNKAAIRPGNECVRIPQRINIFYSGY